MQCIFKLSIFQQYAYLRLSKASRTHYTRLSDTDSPSFFIWIIKGLQILIYDKIRRMNYWIIIGGWNNTII